MNNETASIKWSIEEMSIAGDPQKYIDMGKAISTLLYFAINPKNTAEIINAQVALETIIKDLKIKEQQSLSRHH